MTASYVFLPPSADAGISDRADPRRRTTASSPHAKAIDMAEWISRIVQARWLVGSLGESATPPWWRSQATSPAGIRILERLYPRTALVASLETAGRAACLVHDVPLARTGHYHLFRLPVLDEVAIRDWLRQPEGIEALRQSAALSDQERLESLSSLAGGEGSTNGQGPVNCGPVDALRRKGTIQKICAAYVIGFTSGRPVFPYLEGERA